MANETEAEAEAAAYFFKVMLGDFAQKMRIPPAFVQNLRNQIGNDMVLEGPSGKGWFVRLCGTNAELEFRQGWGNFVHDHRIEFGDFLVFGYVCKSYFTVRIFGRNGCQKKIADFHNQLPTVLDYDEEKNDQAEIVAKHGGKTNSSGRGRGRPPKNDGHCQSLAGKKHQIVKSAETKTKQKTYQGVYYVSRRRSVTEADRNKALKAASSFTSKKPFCLIIMKPSHVYQGFWLGISKKSRERLQLPCISLEMTLVDPNNKEWPVQYLGRDKIGFRTGLSGGWRRFSLANNLEEGDVCVFEREDNGTTKLKLIVHIFRVVKKCTLYKRMEGTGAPDSTTLSTNHSRKKLKANTVSREDLVINLSQKAYGSEQESNTEQRVKQSQGKKEKGGSDSIQQIKCKPAIYYNIADCRHSRRFTQTCSLLKCPKKELCPAPSVHGQKSISRDEMVLSRKNISLYDVDDDGEQEDLMIIRDNTNGNHVMAPISEEVILSQESTREGPLMTKFIPPILNPKLEASSLAETLSPKEMLPPKTPTTVNSAFNSEDRSPRDGTIDMASTVFASSSSFRTNAQDNLVSRQTNPWPERREKTCHAAVPKKSLGEMQLDHHCIAIQKFLLDQTSCSEAHIREHFGDTPDISKALRKLLKEHRVKRFGAGGKSDPFVYMAIVTLGLSELEKLKQAEETGII